MSCTSEEIAEKRRIAIERLNARKNAVANGYKSKPTQSPGETSKPTFTLPPKQLEVVTGIRSTSFYGKSDSSGFHETKSNPSASTTGKLKSPFNNGRLQSHPYARNTQIPKTNGTPGKIAPVFIRTITCTCAMISETRFVVHMSGFNEQLINVFKSVPSKQYDPASKDWSFAIQDYLLVQEKVNALKPNASVGPLPAYVLRLFSKGTQPKPSRDCLNALDPALANSLLEFQKEGVCFAIDKGGRALIADEMGLGKTYQAIAVADFYKEDWPLLICTTASTRDAWAAKIRELLHYVPVHSIVTLQSGQDYIGDARILISSYSLMEKCANKLLERGFGFLIMDESHTLKNFKAKCTSVAQELAQKAKRVILLSGTPALSRPVELFTQLQMLDRNFVQFKEYSTRYCAGKQSNFGWDSSGQSNLTELNLLLAAKFMIRRTKQDVLSQLTEKNRETVILDPALLGKNEETEENLNSYAADYSMSKGREREEILFKYYNITSEVKAPAVCAYLKQLLKEKQKFIIFAHHIFMLDAICKQLVKRKIDHIRIDGTTRSDLRSQLVNKFQTKDSCRTAVLSLKACNAGITLTAAQMVIFAELDWNPSTLAQAESRAHRIGQQSNVTVRYLLAKGTADDIIWTMLQKKQGILTKAGLCNEDFSDSTHVDAPCSSGNIEPFLVKTNNNNEKATDTLSPAVSAPSQNEPKEFQDLLNDGEDDDLAEINL
ncbi:SWI/SNF-related matrix-associated actin-dependent regulator of chromatin subfamily A-like protein 1 [Sabethes cyaneus]|uniref:SWI/SNF-related matrix-associated actin-dependent regulator of chromatin subfamily A-like protein 1 n=1 Tax=Sabethes cyaneus TaxID=53552 RepID=UPI00237D9BAD|nr:SWI/SNF-related matrix-associated actin-dependent regulator of chromatin subfamily A-like protein 1 [Sabethes cyaneus]